MKNIELNSEKTICLLEEPLIGAFGLPKDKHYVGVKGDPTLRETVPLRSLQPTMMDENAEQILSICQHLLENTGCYSLYIGFNSNEIRTESIFDPFNYEVHTTKDILKHKYVDRHFVPIDYEEKLKVISGVRKALARSSVWEHLPDDWKKTIKKREKDHAFSDKSVVGEIVSSLQHLRTIDGFYLRNADISMGQGTVRANFNCDGTYYVKANHFSDFVREIIPEEQLQAKPKKFKP